jgi:hypothetical protein
LRTESPTPERERIFIAVRGAKNAAFTTLSNPTALQNAAFPLLGAQHVRVQ